MSLPVLADPFWGRAAFPVTSRSGKKSKHTILVVTELRSAGWAMASVPTLKLLAL
jgi:hypothetical protein